MSGDAGSALARRLREAAEAELVALVDAHLERLDPPTARHLFRNPFLTGALIERLAAVPELAAACEIRREVARHPRAPRVLALRFVSGLHWADLLAVASEIRVHPVVRRAADQRLIDRLPGLSVGEKMAVARGGGVAVIAAIRVDPTPRVIGALLENPRLTEGHLVPLAASPAASPRVLALLAASPRWAVRSAIRSALCRNPATPLAASLPLLPLLSRRDLAAVASDERLLLPVRQRARLLGGEPREGRQGGARPLRG